MLDGPLGRASAMTFDFKDDGILGVLEHPA